MGAAPKAVRWRAAQRVLSNGARLCAIDPGGESSEALELSFHGGAACDPFEAPGATHVVEHLLYATAPPEAAPLAVRLREGGGEPVAVTDVDRLRLYVVAARGGLRDKLPLIAAALRSPLVTAERCRTARQQVLAELSQTLTPRRRALSAVVHAAGDPVPSGHPVGVRRVDEHVCERVVSRLLVPRALTAVSVGSGDVRARLSWLSDALEGSWRDAARTAITPSPKRDKTRAPLFRRDGGCGPQALGLIFARPGVAGAWAESRWVGALLEAAATRLSDRLGMAVDAFGPSTVGKGHWYLVLPEGAPRRARVRRAWEQIARELLADARAIEQARDRFSLEVLASGWNIPALTETVALAVAGGRPPDFLFEAAAELGQLDEEAFRRRWARSLLRPGLVRGRWTE